MSEANRAGGRPEFKLGFAGAVGLGSLIPDSSSHFGINTESGYFNKRLQVYYFLVYNNGLVLKYLYKDPL
jgi:hypothetical protein